MDEVIIHLDKSSHPIDVHCAGEVRPCNGFLLLASVPAEPPGCVMLSYGNSNATGVMLMTMYQRSVHEHPEMAWVLEQVARGIVEFADKERARWPEDDMAGNA